MTGDRASTAGPLTDPPPTPFYYRARAPPCRQPALAATDRRTVRAARAPRSADRDKCAWWWVGEMHSDPHPGRGRTRDIAGTVPARHLQHQPSTQACDTRDRAAAAGTAQSVPLYLTAHSWNSRRPHHFARLTVLTAQR